jgi:hypothetical protein
MIIPSTLDTSTCVRWPLVSTLPPLGALPSAPGAARAHVDIVLAEWQMGDLADTGKLVASELVTNAVKESTTPEGEPIYADRQMPLIWVCLLSDRSNLVIEVHDQARGWPVMQDAGPDAVSGRGLQMIDRLTGGQWGSNPKIGRPGKCVWAALPLYGSPAMTAAWPGSG